MHATRVFDGNALQQDATVEIVGDKVLRIDRAAAFAGSPLPLLELGDATLLPGFIELHAHLEFRHVPADVVLRHGITTLRDVGGPLHPPSGGDGKLRMLTSGPILTAPNGYPIPALGQHNIARPIADEAEARQAVRELAAGGAAVIKIALEPGGEPGAPWSSGHAHSHGHHHDHAPIHTTQRAHSHTDHAQATTRWPLLPPNVVSAIVDQAHQAGLKVTAHIAETEGARIALEAGVDEWAHTPCAALPAKQWQQAANQGVKVVGTLDTLAKCPGVFENAQGLHRSGVELLYGAEIAHPDIPWGIDAQELLYLQQATGMHPIDLLQTATAKAGRHLGIPLLGTLQAGAPADLIAIPGDALANLKSLEYPDLVISGGTVVVNRFSEKTAADSAVFNRQVGD